MYARHCPALALTLSLAPLITSFGCGAISSLSHVPLRFHRVIAAPADSTFSATLSLLESGDWVVRADKTRGSIVAWYSFHPAPSYRELMNGQFEETTGPSFRQEVRFEFEPVGRASTRVRMDLSSWHSGGTGPYYPPWGPEGKATEYNCESWLNRIEKKATGKTQTPYQWAGRKKGN